MSEKKDTAVEEIVETMMDDPDAPEKGNTAQPQTIDAEPSEANKDAR